MSKTVIKSAIFLSLSVYPVCNFPLLEFGGSLYFLVL